MTTTAAPSDIDKLMIIPPYVDRSKVDKRKPDNEKLAARIALLKPQQLDVFKAVEEFNKTEAGIHVMKGYAGTGKTFVTSAIIEAMLLSNGHQNMAVTAPTNKAVKVLKDMFEFTDPRLQFSTVHKLLGLKEQITGYGQQLFVRDFKNASSIDSLSLLVIDETSMLNDELFDMIYPYVERNQLRIIFVGDPAQIPPVGKKDCIPFNPKMQEKYKMTVGELTEIIRQQNGNPIIEMTWDVRSNPLVPDPIRARRGINVLQDDGAGVYFLGPDDREVFVNMLRAYFTSENFQKDPDFAKVIAWRNDTVGKFNRLIRSLIYGKQRSLDEALIVGEKLIANKPICEVYDDRTMIVFNNNDEFEVMEFEVKRQIFWKTEYTYYSALVNAGEGRKERIKILHPDSYEDYTNAMAALKDLALAKAKGSWQAKEAWTNWYAFGDVFADVGYNYAITAHKSQGSTYQNCIVIEGDLDYNKNVVERNRIKYTAFSRPSHRLIVAQ